jgi:hypothetical protein
MQRRGRIHFYLGASGEVAHVDSLRRAVDLMTAIILVAIVGYVTDKLIAGTIEKRTIEKWEVQPI